MFSYIQYNLISSVINFKTNRKQQKKLLGFKKVNCTSHVFGNTIHKNWGCEFNFNYCLLLTILRTLFSRHMTWHKVQ